MNPFVRRLGIRVPLIQSPMAGVSTPALAAAVAKAGGLGSVAIGHLDRDDAQAAIAETRRRVNGPFNVNVFCHQPAIRDAAKEDAWIERLAPLFERFHATPHKQLKEIYQSYLTNRAMQELLLVEKPSVVSFHFGIPSTEHLDELRKRATYTLATVTNLDDAILAQEAGVDALIAQGVEAGGHRGVFDPDATDKRLSTLGLTALLSQHIRLPIISAGGIMNADDVTAALDCGAIAVQVGTAFLLCPEVSIDAGYRTAIRQASSRGTAMTRAISGRPARSMVNEFTKFGDTLPASISIPSYPVAYDVGKALRVAAQSAGNQEYGAQWAGEGAVQCESIPAGDVVERLTGHLPISRS